MAKKERKGMMIMGEEKPKKKGHSVGLGKVVGFVVIAVFVGMILGGYLAFAVVQPELQKLNINIGNQGNTNDQNTNNNNNQSNNPNNNNQNGNGNTGDQNNNNNQNNNGNQNNNNQNSGNQGSISNNNPSITNPTGQYSATSCQFNVNIPVNGAQESGTITANVNCIVQQNGNDILLSLTITPTAMSDNLNQAMGNSAVTFNFSGSTSGSQITATASGTTGNANFDFNLNGSITTNSLTFTMTSASDSQISVSTQQTITLSSS